MDLFLDDKTSLKLLRVTRWDHTVSLQPCDVVAPQPLGLTTAKLNRLAMPGLLSTLRIPESEPLGVLVPNARSRIRSRDFACTVLKRPRGAHPFLRLVSRDNRLLGPLVPEDSNVYALSAPNIVLGMAKRLRQRVIDGKLTKRVAVLMLLKLCLELCGTFAHSPHDPKRGAVVYGIEPSLNTKDLLLFLSDSGTEQGLALARKASALAYDLSGSPQESFMGPALFGSVDSGGLALAPFVANKALVLNAEQRALIEGRTITPDFYLSDYNSVIEFKGDVHNTGDNPRIDHVRDLDYQTLGIRDFSFVYDDVRTQEAFNKSAARIVVAIAQRDGQEATNRFMRLLKNGSFLRRQYTMFEVFRPWLR